MFNLTIKRGGWSGSQTTRRRCLPPKSGGSLTWEVLRFPSGHRFSIVRCALLSMPPRLLWFVCRGRLERLITTKNCISSANSPGPAAQAGTVGFWRVARTRNRHRFIRQPRVAVARLWAVLQEAGRQNRCRIVRGQTRRKDDRLFSLQQGFSVQRFPFVLMIIER